MAAKTKTPSKPAPPALSPHAAIVDELGDLERELAPFKAKISRAEALRKLLRSIFDASPPGEPCQALGARYVADLGPRGNQTVIDYPVLVKELKPAVFATFATCTLAALEKNAPAELVAKVTRLEATGPRALTVTAKAA